MNKFLDLETVNPKLKILQSNFEKIQSEFLANKDKIFAIDWGAELGYYVLEYKENSSSNDKSLGSVYKGWKVAPLYGSINDMDGINNSLNKYKDLVEIDNSIVKVKHNTRMLPTLTKTLLECDVVKRVGITILEPGKKIEWHIDPDPEKPGLAIIRGLWGLDVPEEEGRESFLALKEKNQKQVFKNNEFVLFWGRSRHKAVNNLTQPRYMVCFDTEVPYKKLRLNS
jgi:hypothetical protein